MFIFLSAICLSHNFREIAILNFEITTTFFNFSDRSVLSRPSMDLVMWLLEALLASTPDKQIGSRLAAALAACAQLSVLPASQRFVYIFCQLFVYFLIYLYLHFFKGCGAFKAFKGS